jgi:DNA excision repair protein ERCC-2
MAIVLSKLFMRSISQNRDENQTGISLWTLEDVRKAQEKQKTAEVEARESNNNVNGEPGSPMMDDDDEYSDVGVGDEVLATMDIEGL